MQRKKGFGSSALNVPFYIPSRIRVGGLDSLSKTDRMHLPDIIDTTNADHRAYLEEIFNLHAFSGRDKFEFFYEAQCTWEDAMADAVAENLGSGKMVVLAGNGHIIRKFGIPNRAFARSHAHLKPSTWRRWALRPNDPGPTTCG
jgi:uncharacterized iron-regulated protein